MPCCTIFTFFFLMIIMAAMGIRTLYAARTPVVIPFCS